MWFPWRQKFQQKESFDLRVSQKLLKVICEKTNSICKSWFADRSFEPCSSVLSIFDNKSREDHFKSIDSSATELSTNMLIKYTVKLPTNALMKKNYVWMFVHNVLMKNCARALQNVSVHQAMKNELEITQSV